MSLPSSSPKRKSGPVASCMNLSSSLKHRRVKSLQFSPGFRSPRHLFASFFPVVPNNPPQHPSGISNSPCGFLLQNTARGNHTHFFLTLSLRPSNTSTPENSANLAEYPQRKRSVYSQISSLQTVSRPTSRTPIGILPPPASTQPSSLATTGKLEKILW